MDNYSKIRLLQRACMCCGSRDRLQAHHRVFRSEGDIGIRKLIESFSEHYSGEIWTLNSIQNLVILCENCHINKIHNGDLEMRELFRNSYTSPETGFNIPFIQPKRDLF